jgi:hypothetical protein
MQTMISATKTLILLSVLLMSSLTVSGQFTPQRLVINGQSGVFLTPVEERAVLTALVDLRYYSKGVSLRDSIILDSEKRITDKNLEIKLLTTKYNETVAGCKKLGNTHNALIEDYNKLTLDNETLKGKNNIYKNCTSGLDLCIFNKYKQNWMNYA